MFFANDADGNRVEIFDASFDKGYFCPVCGKDLIMRFGMVNAPHFAHRQGGCTDNWHYDMSAWHLKMQKCFPVDCREVVISDEYRTHRADIKVNDIVIEFQNSPISAEEFSERNHFFRELGLRIAWVFNLEDRVDNETLYEDPDRPNLMIWKHPMRIFSEAPPPSNYNNEFALWFARCTEGLVEDSNASYEYIYKAVWAAKDDYGRPSYKRFVLGNHSICLDPDEEVRADHFFFSNKDYLFEALSELKKKSTFEIKYIGEKGHPKNAYICPQRPDRFGLNIRWRGTGCLKCKYCAMLARKARGEEEKWAIYCCYPNRIHFYDEDHAPDAPIYDL